MRRTFLIALLSCITQYSFSGPYSYECTVRNELHPSEEGKLTSDYQVYLNSIFHVDRKTGIVLGGGLGNSSYKTRTIIDPGGEEHSFKIVWMSHPVAGIEAARNTVYLQVYEYDETPLKRFVAVEGENVLSGTCN